MTDLPTLIAKMPTAEKITADWGERCPDHDGDCFCCQMWAAHDAVSALLSRIEELERERLADDIRSTIDGDRHFFLKAKEAEARATSAEAKLSEAADLQYREWPRQSGRLSASRGIGMAIEISKEMIDTPEEQVAFNRRMIKRWKEIAMDGPEGNEPLGAAIRRLEMTTDILSAVAAALRHAETCESRIRSALTGGGNG